MFNFETYINNYGTAFTIWDMEDHFIVVVNDETHTFNTVADAYEFIQYYNYYA